MSNSAITPASCRAARGLLKWSMRELAQASGVAFTTINKFENGASLRVRTAVRIADALAAHGVSIIVQAGSEGAVLAAEAPSPPERTAEAIVETIVRVARLARKGDRRSGLGGSHLSLLVSIRYNTGISLKALASLEGVAHPTMSRMVKSLVARGWVTRSRSGDARFQRLSLTEEGHAVFESAWSRRVQAMVPLAASLSPVARRELSAKLSGLASQLGMPAERLARRGNPSAPPTLTY